MKRSKNLLRKGAALAAMSTVLVSQAPLINAFAYGEADVSQSTFKQDTDNSADFQNWLSKVMQRLSVQRTGRVSHTAQLIR